MRISWLLGILGVIASSPGISLAENETQKSIEVSTTTSDAFHSSKLTVKIEEIEEEMQKEISSSGKPFDDFKKPIHRILEESSIQSFENEIEMKPKNVVLLMIEGNVEASLWTTFKEKHSSFSHGFLQNCRVLEVSNNSSIVNSHEKECNCRKRLKSNMGILLNWAQQNKSMETGTVFTANYTIFLESIGSLGRIEVKKFDGEKLSNSWGLSIVDNKSSSSPDLFSKHKDGHRDSWNLTNIFSRIRLTWIKSLLEFLRETFKCVGKKSQTDYVKIVEESIRKLKEFPNKSGYLFIVVIPATEFLNITETLEHETSSNDTLFIISETCSENDRDIPIFSRGPGSSRILNKTKTIIELPTAIKFSLEHCNGLCKHKSSPFSSFDIPKKRVARSDDEDEEGLGEEEHSNEEISPEASSSESSAESTESSNPDGEELEARSVDETSGSSICRESMMELFLGLAATITTMFVLHT